MCATRFRKKIRREISDRIVAFGLTECPVCNGTTLSVSPYPVMVSYGGIHYEKGDPRHDAEANVNYMLKVECSICGYVMLFNSEQHRGPDEKTLVAAGFDDQTTRASPGAGRVPPSAPRARPP